jgi:hypothetical protein
MGRGLRNEAKEPLRAHSSRGRAAVAKVFQETKPKILQFENQAKFVPKTEQDRRLETIKVLALPGGFDRIDQIDIHGLFMRIRGHVRGDIPVERRG